MASPMQNASSGRGLRLASPGESLPTGPPTGAFSDSVPLPGLSTPRPATPLPQTSPRSTSRFRSPRSSRRTAAKPALSQINPIAVPGSRTCSIEGCIGRPIGWGWCERHYRRWRAHGDPLKTVKPVYDTIEDRFFAKVDKDGPLPAADTLAAGRGSCWLWTACTGSEADGYGHFRAGPTDARAHRWLYEHLYGSVPAGLHLDHLCRVRRCVNPDHLEAVPPRVNVLRGVGAAAQAARKTHCPQGHEYTPENTYREPANPRHRQCRTCILAKNKTDRRLEGPAPIVPCPICGTPFRARKSPQTQTGRQRTCSQICGQTLRSLRTAS